ncbi:MAG: HAMP domain-containing histidine kinase [Kamptonema sp. SIO1D9]|nr:HAMP domain-containing histidine kinase [Kamptonema sp. SIO1D9]
MGHLVSYHSSGHLVQDFSSEILSPYLSPGSDRDLSLDSTLRELPLYDFRAELTCLGIEVARIFQKDALLPGAILTEEGEYAGIISRRQFLEFLLLPHGRELFLQHPLEVLHSYNRQETLILPGDTPILSAAQQALRRSPLLQSEPIVVKLEPSVYRLLDFQQLNLASWQIRGIETQVRYERTQARMIQTEKMASLGRLVDGIAHEILDPVGFIWGNLTYVSTYTEALLELIAAYEEICQETNAEIVRLKEEIELDFLQQDLPRAVGSIKTGAERLKKLSVSLQNFCHIDEVYPKPADINSCLDGIILLLKNRLQSEIEIVKNYGHLPPVTCYIGEISQVFMNILTNAVDALLNEAVSQKLAQEYGRKRQETVNEKPRIEITTQVWFADTKHTKTSVERWVSVRIRDNGPGMPQKTQREIRETFSVKKRAAKETSLAVSYQIVTAKHGGEIKLRSQPGMGTEFEILLPLV